MYRRYDYIVNKIMVKWYFLKNLLLPSRWKFWIVRPKTLRIGYNDARDLILHTSMQLLCEFIHYQNTDGHVAWDHSEETRLVWKEMCEIAHWWTDIYPHNGDIWNIPEHLEEASKSFDYLGSGDMDESYTTWIQERNILERDQDKLEHEMLIRLATIQPYLWD